MFIKQLTVYMLITACLTHRDVLCDLVNTSSLHCDAVESLKEISSSIHVGDDLTWDMNCLTNWTFEESTLEDHFLLANNSSTTTTSDDSETIENTNPPDWYIIFRRFQFVTTGIYFPLATFAAIAGNTIVIVVLCKGHVQSNCYVYLLGLASANLIFSVTYCPRLFRAYDSVQALRSYQTFYAYYVVYVSPISSTAHTSAVWVIILFTVERFVAVAFPMKAQMYFSATRSKIAVCAAFAIGILLNFIRFFRRQIVAKIDEVTGEQYYSYTLHEIGRNETYNAITFWSYLILTEVIPFPTLLSLNSLVIHRLWQAKFRRTKLSTGNTPRDKGQSSTENQITRLLIAIVMAFLTCNVAACAGSIYVAIHGSSILYTMSTPDLHYLFSLGATLYNTNPVVNCIMYTVFNKAMRNGIKSVLCMGRRVNRDTHNTQATAVRNGIKSVLCMGRRVNRDIHNTQATAVTSE